MTHRVKGGEHDSNRTDRAAARPRVVDPEGPVSAPAPPAAPVTGGATAFCLRPSVEPFAAPDGDIYVLRGGAGAVLVIRDPDDRVRALLAALDVRPMTVTDISSHLDAVGVAATGAEIAAALSALRGAGLLHEVRGEVYVGSDRMARLDRQLAWLADRFGTDDAVAHAQGRLMDARIAILGCGGLGSWAAVGLACVGVGALVLVDDDTVELSNLNRQILFGRADVG